MAKKPTPVTEVPRLGLKRNPLKSRELTGLAGEFAKSQIIEGQEIDLSRGLVAEGINIPPFPEKRVDTQPDPIAMVKEKEAEPFEKFDYTLKERSTISNKPGFERWDPPSRGLWYDWDNLEVRRFTIDDLLVVNRGVQNQNITLLIDGLGRTINQDIRKLTIPDFHYLMFWHRINSYLKTPYTVVWTSKYGNENETSIKNSNILTTDLKMTPEEVASWKSKKLAPPTVGDMELFEDIKNPDLSFYFMRAQWISLDHLKAEIEELVKQKNPIPRAQARIDYLRKVSEETGGIDLLEDIRDFRKSLGDYGVKEVITVVDEKFDPNKWLETLKTNLAEIEKVVKISPEVNIDEQLDIIRLEIASVESKLNLGEKVKPEEETIRLAFDAWNLLPGI